MVVGVSDDDNGGKSKLHSLPDCSQSLSPDHMAVSKGSARFSLKNPKALLLFLHCGLLLSQDPAGGQIRVEAGGRDGPAGPRSYGSSAARK